MSFELGDLSEDTFASKLNDSVEKLSQGQGHLVTIVEELGPLLTDIAVGKRRLGLSFLSKVLTSLRQDSLNKDECNLLGQFYADRMRDHHSLIPDVISGMEVLFRMSNFTGPELQSLLRSSFNEIHAQSHVLADRSKIFAYHNFLLCNKLDQILPLGMDYLLGFIQAVDEEKDPNNLLLIFSSWPIVLDSFELEPLTDDAFDTLACYFPIDFTPPSGVIGSVTREDLVQALRHCLADFPIFAPKSIPLFLEKLGSDLTDAKIDSALSLAKCLSCCAPEHAGLFLDQIWNALRTEIMGVRLQTNEQVVQSCLDALKAGTHRLATVVQTPENRILLTKWLDKIWTDCGRHLKDLELKFMASSIDIFSTVVGSSADFPAIFVLDRAVPTLVELYHSRSSDSSSCVSILRHISKLVKNAPAPVVTPDWYESLLFICNSAMTNPSDPALQGAACHLLNVGIKFLKAEHCDQIFAAQLEKILAGKAPGNDAVDLFGSLIVKCSRPTDEDLARLFETLPQYPDAVLPLLKVLCRQPAHLGKIYPRVAKGLWTDSASNASEFSWCVQLSREIWQQHKNLDYFLSSPNLLEHALERALQLEPCPQETESKLRSLLSDISRDLTEAHVLWIENVARKLICNSANRGRSFSYLETLLCALRQRILSLLAPDLFVTLFSSTNVDDCNELTLARAKIRSSLVNKLAQPDKYVNQILDDSNSNPQTKSGAVDVGWTLRGLLLRNHPAMVKIVKVVLQYLKSTEPGVADQMALSLAEAVSSKGSDFLDENSTLSSLARQKLFMITKPDLIAAYNDGINPSAHLKSVICQLDFLPKFALSNEISGLVPLLAKGLNCADDDDLVIATLASLKDILVQDAKSFGTILPTFLPVWIGLATNRNRKMPIRIEALKCIKVSCKSDQQEVVKQKREVMKQLVPALDDHKRLVRKEAAAARNAWALAT